MDIENEHIKTNLTYKYINNFTKDTDFRGKRFKRYTEKIKDIVLNYCKTNYPLLFQDPKIQNLNDFVISVFGAFYNYHYH